jgi:hydroxyacylglutathione hydrolase
MEIVPGIHQVDGVNGNAYIFVRNGLTVIDTGISGSGHKILTYIRESLHREPGEIRTIVITHFHLDHTGGIGVLKQAAPDARLAIGKADAGYLDGSLPLPIYPGFRGILLRAAGTVMNPGRFTPDNLLEDGDRIDGLRCIHIPGHTPGSIGLLDEETKTFFAGDLLRSDGKTLTEGPAPFTLDLAASHRSIRKIAALDFECLLPGHGVAFMPRASDKVREYAGTLGPETR